MLAIGVANLATGHPAVPIGGTIDPTPLLYWVIILGSIRAWGIWFRLWMVPLALFVGGLVDTVADGLGVTEPSVVAVLLLLGVAGAWRRRRWLASLPPGV
jgi:MYXO-CTERM domain-containing protein